MITKILTHLGLSAWAPPRSPPRPFDRFQMAFYEGPDPLPSGSTPRADSLLWPALARGQTPRIRAPQVDERPGKFPILDRRLASLTTHRPIGTIPLAEKGHLKFLYLSPPT